MQDISRYLKNFRNFMIIFATVYLIMGIALIASPDGMSKILGIVVGLIAMALGAFVMTEYFRYQRLSSILASELFSGGILILIGFILIMQIPIFLMMGH